MLQHAEERGRGHLAHLQTTPKCRDNQEGLHNRHHHSAPERQLPCQQLRKQLSSLRMSTTAMEQRSDKRLPLQKKKS